MTLIGSLRLSSSAFWGAWLCLEIDFSFFDGNTDTNYSVHTTSHYTLILCTHDRMIITVIVLSSRQSGSVYYGLDQMIILRTTKQFFSPSLSNTPHYYMSLIYIIGTIMLPRVWALQATLMRYDVISRDWVIHTWANRGKLYELITTR